MSEELNDGVSSRSVSQDGVEVRSVQIHSVIDRSVVLAVTNRS